MKIAVLLTTFNRREKTLSCLQSLKNLHLPADTTLEIFLTDDNSADGTAAAVATLYSEVHLYKGNGSLFWAGGMRATWQHALQSDADYFLLLNDDTILRRDAISILLESSRVTSKPAICIGSTVDENTGKMSYGGNKVIKSKIWKSVPVHSETDYVQCDFGNANIMLVPRIIVDKIGILSGSYTHGLADYDYGLTAKKAGFDVLVAPGFLGNCVDDHGNNWLPRKTTLQQRIKYLKSPKGLAYKEFLHFIRNHFPLSYPTVFSKLWLKTLFPVLWDTFKK